VFPILDVISRFFAREQRRCAAYSEIAILCVVGNKRDESLIRETCREHGWSVSFAGDTELAQRQLERYAYQIVLLDREVAGDAWRQAISGLAAAGALCILLIPKVFDDHLWNEVVRRGGYDILPKPLRREDLARAIRLAWSYWMGAHRPTAIPAD